MEEEPEIVNKENKSMGKALRSNVHKKGLFHRAAHVFLINSQGKIFLQKRAAGKDICPNHWDMSAAEHLQPGETFEEAAIRGIREELGIATNTIRQLRGPRLQHLVYENGLIDNEFVSLFVVRSEKQPVIDPEEVADGKFFTKEEIDRDITAKRRLFAPWFLEEWREFTTRNVWTE